MVQKINAKLGGRNAKVVPSLQDRTLMKIPTLIYGADVSHAAPGSTQNSIAAVVGNVDDHCATYVARLSTQASRVEVIEDLQTMAVRVGGFPNQAAHCFTSDAGDCCPYVAIH